MSIFLACEDSSSQKYSYLYRAEPGKGFGGNLLTARQISDMSRRKIFVHFVSYLFMALFCYLQI